MPIGVAEEAVACEATTGETAPIGVAGEEADDAGAVCVIPVSDAMMAKLLLMVFSWSWIR